MKGMTIVEAGPGDLDKLMQWRMEVLHEVFGIPAGVDTTELERNNRNYYRSALAEGRHLACFACVEGQTVGCGGVCFQAEMPSPDNLSGRCAYLMNIYVRPPFRHRCIGRSIVRWLVEHAQARGATKIYLETSDAGRNLYRRMGFVPMEDLLKLQTIDRKEK